MKTRVLFDCERMKYSNTGIYHYCLNLGNSLLKNGDPDKEEFSFYLPEKISGTFGSKHIHVSQSSLHKFYMPSLDEFSIWHSTYQNTDYMPLRNKKIKVVLTIHDLNFIYDEKKSPQKKEKYLRHLQNNINRSDAIVCISGFCKNDVMTYCDTGNKPVHIIHNGTNSLLSPTLTIASYKPTRPFLFTIGVITRKKNFHALLPLLENNDMELLIAGRKDDSEYLNFLLESAQSLGVEKNVRILGDITEQEKSWYFQNCYAFASPSLAEGFCMPLAEAMSVGKPLFLADKTALPEIGGRVAFYFRDFNKRNMQNVFLHGMNCYNERNMQEEIKERSAVFCWDKAARQYLDVYRSLI